MAVAIVSYINMGFRVYIKGYMVISMRHVTGDWVTFYDFALSGRVPHGNNNGSLNMHTRDMVCILIDSQ